MDVLHQGMLSETISSGGSTEVKGILVSVEGGLFSGEIIRPRGLNLTGEALIIFFCKGFSPVCFAAGQ